MEDMRIQLASGESSLKSLIEVLNYFKSIGYTDVEYNGLDLCGKLIPEKKPEAPKPRGRPKLSTKVKLPKGFGIVN